MRFLLPHENTERKAMSILTQAHRDHFDEYGYMVIENAVPIELYEAVVDAIFAFLERGILIRVFLESVDPMLIDKQ